MRRAGAVLAVALALPPAGQARALTPSGRPGAAAAPARSAEAGIDVGSVVETVSHHVSEASPGVFEVSDPLYTARFEPSGVALTNQPGFRLSVEGFDPGPWRAELNRAERDLAPGLRERWTARDGSLEWDVLLASPPRGDLRVDAAIAGASGEPMSATHDGAPVLRWPLGGGRSIRMGELVVSNASGRELFRALPDASADRVTLRVPHAALAGAAYPVTVDPTLSPEYPASDSTPVPAPFYQGSPAVAAGGGSFLVVWEDSSGRNGFDIRGARVSAAGSVLDPAGIAITEGPLRQSKPAVAWDGVNFLVVWEDSRNNQGVDIYGSRVGTDGRALEPDGIPISTAGFNQLVPALAWNGSTFLVVWQDQRFTPWDIFGARIDRAGRVLDPAGIAVSTAPNDQIAPQVASDGTSFLVVWDDRRAAGLFDVYAARVISTGAVLPEIPVRTGAGRHHLPQVAWGGGSYLVAWYECCPGDVLARRVGADGLVLDAADIAIATGTADQGVTGLASDGNGFFVVWHENRGATAYDIYAARVASNGSILDPGGFTVSAALGDEFRPKAAWDGTRYLVAWERGDSGSADIYAARVTGLGAVEDPSGRLVSGRENRQLSPAVAWDGSNFLVVWEDYRGDTADIYGARVGATGAILDGSGIAISTAVGYQTLPDVAAGAGGFLVVWRDSRADALGDVFGARVTSAGLVQDPIGIPVSRAVNTQGRPRVAWNGATYLVVWEDRRSAGGVASLGLGTFYDQGYDVYGARVRTDGTVADAQGIPISTSLANGLRPEVASDGAGFFVVWEDRLLNDVVGARVTASGRVQDPFGINVSASPAAIDVFPALAWNGETYLVAWYRTVTLTTAEVYAARIDARGAGLDTSGFVVSAPGDPPAREIRVAASGTGFVVAWDWLAAGLTIEMKAARVTGLGEAPESGRVQATVGPYPAALSDAAQGPQGRTAIAYTGLSASRTERTFLRFFDQPPHDDMADAEEAAGDSGALSRLSFGASKEPGEPAHAGEPGGASVWYRWVPGKDGTATFDTIGSGFDTLMGVYTSDLFGALTPVVSDDDSAGGGWSRASFSANASTEYLIAVDGKRGASGPVKLNWDLVTGTTFPSTTIGSGPTGFVSSAQATFVLSSSQPGGSFQCALDTDVFSACSSPQSYPNLPTGSHSFRVMATAAGVPDPTPASRSWVVDTSAPVAGIAAPAPGVYAGGQPVVPGGPAVILVGGITVAVEASDAQSPIRSVCFSVDGGPFGHCKTRSDGGKYLFDYRPVTPGPHTIAARATNAAGLDATASLQVVATVPA